MNLISDPVPALLSAQYSRFAERTFQARADIADFVAARRHAPIDRALIEARFTQRLDASREENSGDPYEALCAALRLLRTDVFCLAMERDLAGMADLAEITAAMSDLAEVTLGRALQQIEAELTERFGWPLAESDNTPLTLGVVGMGKLGGRELNVSSDIDLIFVYEEDGQTAGGVRPSISNQDFFTRMGRKLIGALAERTAHGYVFRVDMRLRPNGDAGPLVCSLAMLEEYFYVQGREWERYAWIKGRLLRLAARDGTPAPNPTTHPAAVSEDRLAAQLGALVQPFVYRRYLDFGVIDAIRSLHEQIGQEARRRASLRPELSDDIKLGRGGIREIEFGAQVFQLVRGGQDAGLRVLPTLQVLARAAERGLIGEANVAALGDAYVFLRRLEHRLQYADDAQTHAMPVDEVLRARLAASMGFADYASLHAALDEHRTLVETEFDQIFDKPAASGHLRKHGEPPANAQAVQAAAQQAACLWSETLFDPSMQDALEAAAHGLGYSTDIIARLRATRMSLRYVELPSLSLERFDALVKQAIVAAAQVGRRERSAVHDASGAAPASDVSSTSASLALAAPAAKTAAEEHASGAHDTHDNHASRDDKQDGPQERAASLSRLLDFLDRIGGRSAYLALLTEYPAALRRVLDVLGNSRWAAQYLLQHPQLLDELLDDEAICTPFDWQDFCDGLRVRLAASDGVEQQMDQLRRAQHAEVFRILLRDLAGRLRVEEIGDRLSELADTVLNVTLETVWRSIRDRPRFDDDLPRFAIIAYGKLGGKELGYASDLDLIFLYDDDDTDDATEIYSRLARRLVTWLTTATGAGQLYDIDLRLRPNGSSGLLVTSLDGFRSYQLRDGQQANTAWVWEHQAITRARFCAGDERIGAAFDTIRTEVLTRERDPLLLKTEIAAMRERARDGHPNRTALFDLKQDRGGMVDIEFIVQYLILLHAREHRELVANSGNIALLGMLAGLSVVSQDDARTVSDAYRRYRALQHRLRLDGVNDARVPKEGVERERHAVIALWERVFA
jgi:glutamate-ammonia-ligase adenylyltransferase